MKLATLKNGTRDGCLVVVSRDLKWATPVADIAPTLQAALDSWEELAPRLQIVYEQLNAGKITSPLPFNQQAIAAPLPRSYQWADGSAYLNHVELVRKARGAEIPANMWEDPLLYQGGSDTLLGAYDTIQLIDEAHGLDFESEVAVITRDVPMGASKEVARDCICLVMLVNDVSLRNLIPAELAKGFGFYQSKPSSSFSSVAVTPDEFGEKWDGGKVHLPLETYLNGQLFGKPNAGIDMAFDFPTLIAYAAKTRALSAGTIVGSGTVSNYDRSQGSSCLMEKRMLEILADGKASTPFMTYGDELRITMHNEKGEAVCGEIRQQVEKYSFLPSNGEKGRG